MDSKNSKPAVSNFLAHSIEGDDLDSVNQQFETYQSAIHHPLEILRLLQSCPDDLAIHAAMTRVASILQTLFDGFANGIVRYFAARYFVSVPPYKLPNYVEESHHLTFTPFENADAVILHVLKAAGGPLAKAGSAHLRKRCARLCTGLVAEISECTLILHELLHTGPSVMGSHHMVLHPEDVGAELLAAYLNSLYEDTSVLPDWIAHQLHGLHFYIQEDGTRICTHYYTLEISTAGNVTIILPSPGDAATVAAYLGLDIPADNQTGSGQAGHPLTD